MTWAEHSKVVVLVAGSLFIVAFIVLCVWGGGVGGGVMVGPCFVVH